MKYFITIIIILFLAPSLYSQEEEKNDFVDSLYREDQFYAGVTYNLLGKMPSGVSQNGFSSGFHLGFIRDMPINKKRNVALGLGIGYSANSFNQNLKISKNANGNIVYNTADGFTKNKFSQHLIEVPFEFRWRLSTPTEYKFFRLHTGFKAGYVIANTSKYKGDPIDEKYSGINDFNDFQYALTFSIGYNTWNFYMYYALNPIFSSNVKTEEGNSIEMNAIKIGLIFYVL